jgi:hypothetical protein
MAEQPAKPSVPVAFGVADAEYRFVDTVQAAKPGQTMVYLDFSQQGTLPGTDVGPDRPIHGVSRIVMVPALAETLVQQLTALLHPDGA